MTHSGILAFLDLYFDAHFPITHMGFIDQTVSGAYTTFILTRSGRQGS
ncbi:MAG: hypothetical protein MjAS7_0060 [Metallosphaera javensis (ex Sakai et al. 2022)]|nr:MAG: hypothetical protein MjAS7_0060 [Metallosphaera javensis (ex Sakai et al. 2022)]